MSAAPKLRAADYNEGHPASMPVSEHIPLPEPVVLRDPAFSTASTTMTLAEAEHFKRAGFIVKRGLIDAPAVFAQVIDHMWANVPRALMQRREPSTWIDAPEDEWTEEDSLRVGHLTRNNWKMRSKGPNGIGTEKFLTEGIANHPNMRRIVEALIGGPVQRADRVRGIYAVFPSAPGTPNRYNVHVDNMASHVAAMVIADEIGPGCGGFMLWPGSHIPLHPYWRTVHGGMMSAAQADGFRRAREEILRETQPVEFTGSAGDVIFWHPRLLHSAGINRSAEQDAPCVRVIVPCDYQRAGRDYFDDQTFGPGAEFQWWIDVRNFHGDEPPTADNMWDDWAI